MTRQGLRSIFFVLGPQSVTVKIDTLGPVTAGKAASGRAGRSITLACRITDGLSSDATAICIIVKNSQGTSVKTLRRTARATATRFGVNWTPGAARLKRRDARRHALTGGIA